MRVAKVLLGGVVAWAVASCDGSSSAVQSASAGEDDSPPDPRSGRRPGTRVVPRPQWSVWGRVPWPEGDDVLAAGLRAAELHRDPRAEAIDQAWHGGDPAWRARSMWTLARIGGPIARERMLERLGDGRIEIGAAGLAAFGFLQAPVADESRAEVWDELEDRLWTRYAVTEELDEADALLLAIARVGGPRSSHRLAADLAVLPSEADTSRHVHGIEALAISCVRGHELPSQALSVVAEGLSAERAEIRAAAAYALVRCASVSAEQLAGEERGTLVERLATLTQGDDRSSARGAWRALEGLGELPGVVPATILGSEPGDWMTEVAAVRALVVHADGRKVLARRLALVDPNHFLGPRLHVLRELLERLRPFFAHEDELVEPLRGLLEALDLARGEASADAARTKALILLACEIRLLLATRDAEFSALQRCAEGASGVPEVHGELLVIEALVHMGAVLPREGREAALLERAVDPRPEVASNALGALAGLDAPGVGEALREALSHADMGVVAAAAGAIATRASDSKRRDPGAVPMLLDVVRRFDNDHAVEARIAAITALGRLARSEPETKKEAAELPPWFETDIAPLARDPATAVRAAARDALRGHPERLAAFDAAIPESFPEGFASAVHQASERFGQGVPGLRLVTDAGVITIDFSGAPAPIAQANFAALAEGGFFDGLTFHRVVPGFVIQGGDPRGDGYGGPGHVMPCEWSNLRYERGTVGIALAGKDTGGSQLFIAHDAARHLDARYTVIGKVVEGMEVVDAIWPYDRIERVEILEP